MHRTAVGALLVVLALGAVSGAQQSVFTTSDGTQIVVPPVPGSFVLPQPASVAQARDTRPSSGTSRITGRVTSTNGAPVRMATVQINGQDANVNKTTMTDGDGRYEFRDLPAGHFVVNANKANYLRLNYGQTKPSDISKPLELGANQQLDRVDIVLPRGGVITGRLLDEYGEPVTDAVVYPMQKRLTQGQMRLMQIGRNGMTNDIGEYRLYGLAPGQYYISAYSRSNVPIMENTDIRSGYAPTYYPGTALAANAQPITVGLGETIGSIDLSLLTTRLSSISGIAIDGKGAPLSRGSVTAMDRYGSPTVSGNGQIKPDGSFTIPGLAPGEYIVRASVPPPAPVPVAAGGVGVAAPPAPPPPPPLPPDRVTITALAGGIAGGGIVGGITTMQGEPLRVFNQPEVLLATVTLSGSDVTGVVLAPMKRVTLNGRVTFDSIAGRSLRGNMVRVMMNARSPEAAQMLNNPTVVVKDDFTFQLLAPASEIAIRAVVSSPNQEWVVKAIRMSNVDITDLGVDFRNGRDADIEIELTNRPPEVSGVVLNARGEVVTDYTIVLFPQERERWFLDSRLITSARGDRDGRYRVRTLPPGRYFAAVIQSSMSVQDPDVLETLRGQSTPFTLGDGETKVLDLRVDTSRR